jgi:hypothetical protein
MGRCEYVLAKGSENNTFEVRQVNEPCGNGQPSCTKSLTVIFPNVTIQLLRGSVVVHGNTITTPAFYPGKRNYLSLHIYSITLGIIFYCPGKGLNYNAFFAGEV